MISSFASNPQTVSACPVVVRDLPAYKHAFLGSAMTATRIDGTFPGSPTWSPPV
jgi:hypothetical protein